MSTENNDLIGDVLNFLNKREANGKKYNQRGELISKEDIYTREDKEPYLTLLFSNKLNFRSTHDPREEAQILKGLLGEWVIETCNSIRRLKRMSESDEVTNRRVEIISSLKMKDVFDYSLKMTSELILEMGREEDPDIKNSIDDEVKRYSYWAMVAEEALKLPNE